MRNVPLYVVLHGMDGRVALYPRAGCMGLSYMSAVTACKAHDDEFRTPGLLNALNAIQGTGKVHLLERSNPTHSERYTQIRKVDLCTVPYPGAPCQPRARQGLDVTPLRRHGLEC